ncbi:glycosyltransferase [Omnitrophica bacterium]|nr:glycosyltransferase [Candidatus Omnitrophota bacterium]
MKEPLSEKRDKNRHLLFLIGNLQYGGAERVVINLSRFFAGLGGYRVSILTIEDKADDYSIPDGVKVKRLCLKRGNILGKILSLKKGAYELKRFVANHQVDIVLSFMEWSNAINLWAKKLGSKHRAYINVRTRIKVHYRNINGIFGFFLFKRLAGYIDKIFVNSPDTKDDIVSLFRINTSKVDVIYNPIDLNEVERLSREDVQEDWFQQRDIPIVINVASFTRPKGHKYLLRAFARVAAHRPVRLVLIGDEYPTRDSRRIKLKLQSEVKRLKIVDRVLFLGWRDNPYKYLSRSSLFVLSSVYEAFPNTLLEAMACGLPAISFDCPSGPSEILSPREDRKDDIVRARYGILVKEKNEESLSKAIEELLDDREMMTRYAKAGLERSRQFSLPAVAKDYEALLKR